MAKKSAPAWRPTVTDLIGIGAFIVAVITWLVQPTWQIALPLAILVIVLVVFAAWRHQSHPIVRAIVAVAVVAGFVWLIWPPILKSVRKDYPYVALQSPVLLQWPITFDAEDDDDSDDGPENPISNVPPVIVQQPTIPPAPFGQRPLISSEARFVFSCHFPKQSAADAAKRKLFLQKSLGPWGTQIGFNVSISDVAGGFRVTIIADTDEAKNRFLSMGILPVVAVIFIDVQRYGPETVVVAHADLPKEYQQFTLMTPSINAPQIVEGQKQVGLFFGGNDNSCHII